MTAPRVGPARAALRFLGTVLSVVLLGVVTAAGAALIVVPKANGARPLTILSGSMRGTYDPGSVVVVRPTRAGSLQVGDVITFQPTSGDPQLTTHRIVAVRLTDAGREYVTRGDANGADDPAPVRRAQVRGEVWYSVPYVGYVATWANGASMHTAIDAGAVLLLVYGGYLLAAGAVDRRRSRPETAA